SYRLFGPQDKGYYGKKLLNGTWTGMVGELIHGIADMGTPMSASADNYQDIDFSEPLFIEGFAAAYKRPVPEPDFAGFVKPMSPYSWLLIFMSSLIILIVTGVIFRIY
ncbi:unnamed protein product, partial [Meganyctiphanes norvegica]